jgi:hypothetical protein
VSYSTDDYFVVDGVYIHDRTRLGRAHAWNISRVRKALATKSHMTVVVDNTNLTLSEMLPYYKLAQKYGAVVVLMETATPWAHDEIELTKRNSHQVHLEVRATDDLMY